MNYLDHFGHKDGETPEPSNIPFTSFLESVYCALSSSSEEEMKKIINIINKDSNIDAINLEIKDALQKIMEINSEFINFGIKPEEMVTTEKKGKTFNKKTKGRIKPPDILRFVYYFFKEKKYIPEKTEEIEKLFNYFTYHQEKKVEETEKKIDIQLIGKIIEKLEILCKEFKNIKTINNEMINTLTGEINKIIDYLSTYNAIFIPFLGPSNAGKTTIMNSIIGDDILTTALEECTKRGIIIRNNDSDKIILKKSLLKKEKFLNKTHYYFDSTSKPIAIGKENVKTIINGLNNFFTDSEDNMFYYLKIKLKLFDYLNISDDIKNRIYFIDFPGFGTNNIFEKNNIYNQVMTICNSFFFIVKNSTIKDNNCKEVLSSLYNQAKETDDEGRRLRPVSSILLGNKKYI